LKDYAQNAKKRKEYVQQPCLLVVAVDVSKANHDACIGTENGIVCRKLVGQGRLLRSLGKFIKAISACCINKVAHLLDEILNYLRTSPSQGSIKQELYQAFNWVAILFPDEFDDMNCSRLGSQTSHDMKHKYHGPWLNIHYHH